MSPPTGYFIVHSPSSFRKWELMSLCILNHLFEAGRHWIHSLAVSSLVDIASILMLRAYMPSLVFSPMHPKNTYAHNLAGSAELQTTWRQRSRRAQCTAHPAIFTLSGSPSRRPSSGAARHIRKFWWVNDSPLRLHSVLPSKFSIFCSNSLLEMI